MWKESAGMIPLTCNAPEPSNAPAVKRTGMRNGKGNGKFPSIPLLRELEKRLQVKQCKPIGSRLGY
jgi:hypothetical protein